MRSEASKPQVSPFQMSESVNELPCGRDIVRSTYSRAEVACAGVASRARTAKEFPSCECTRGSLAVSVNAPATGSQKVAPKRVETAAARARHGFARAGSLAQMASDAASPSARAYWAL